MRRPLLLVLAAGLACAASPCLGQSATGAPPAGGTAAAPAAPASAAPAPAASAAPASAEPKNDRTAIKALRAGCRDEAKGQGLRGEAKRAAVSACVVKARPELADREQCRSDGRAKGLKGEGLRSFVKDCLRAKA